MELKLYSPLRAELEEEPVREWIDEPELSIPMPLTGDDLAAPEFHAAILKGIEDEQGPEESERGLMTYFDGSDAVNEKVISVFPSVEEVDGRLYGVAVCQLKEALILGEVAELTGKICSTIRADPSTEIMKRVRQGGSEICSCPVALFSVGIYLATSLLKYCKLYSSN